MKLAPGEPALAFAGWVTKEQGDKIAASIGKTADELLKMADTRGFTADPAAAAFPRTARRRRFARSTRATWWRRIEGSDPQLKNEAVIFSAHWDHLGIGRAGRWRYDLQRRGRQRHRLRDDSRNGARVGDLPEKPRRSALFMAVTAEEAGCAARNITASIR